MTCTTMRRPRNERGQSVVFLALVMSLVLLGFLAFAIDVGYFFREKRLAQAAADAAAVAAAEEVTYENSSSINSDAQSAANAAAAANGFPVTPVLTVQSSGNYSNAGSTSQPSSWVKATVSQQVPTFFYRGFRSGVTSMSVSAIGIAAGNQTSPTCVCLEGTSGTDLSMSNNAKLNAISCGVTADSSSSNAIKIVGSASVTASALSAVASNWDTSTNVNNGGTIGAGTKTIQGLTSTCSSALPAVPTYDASECTADPLAHYGNGGSSYSVGPGSTYSTSQNSNSLVCYNSLTVGTNGDTVNLNSGVYVITGGTLHFESGANGKSNTGGNGVLFYLTNGASVVFDNGANVNLVAGGNTQSAGGTVASTGSFNGILIYEDPGGGTDAGDSQAVSVQGGTSAYFNGAIYAPLAAVTLGNGSGSTVNAQVVAQSLTMNGGGTLNVTANPNMGTANSSVAKLAQ